MGAACPTIGMFPFAKFSLLDPEVLIATGFLAATLFVGAVAIALIDRWRKRELNETYSAHDQLASFRLLYERGELSAEEFDRVRRQLLSRLKHEAAAPPPKVVKPSTAVTETPPAPLPPLPPETETGSANT
jgi:hypothetical protein